jgi:hypothetical protein
MHIVETPAWKAVRNDAYQGVHEGRCLASLEAKTFVPMSAAIFTGTVLVAVDEVPNQNVEPSCRVEVSKTVTDDDMEVCMENERSARAQLVREWAQFTPADKAHSLWLSSWGANRATRIC